MNDVTHILSQIEGGDHSAADQLLPLVYDQLRELAGQHLHGKSPGRRCRPPRWCTTPISAWRATTRRWNSRGHFFAAAAEAMRRILVERRPRKRRPKRRGAGDVWPLDDVGEAGQAGSRPDRPRRCPGRSSQPRPGDGRSGQAAVLRRPGCAGGRRRPGHPSRHRPPLGVRPRLARRASSGGAESDRVRIRDTRPIRSHWLGHCGVRTDQGAVRAQGAWTMSAETLLKKRSSTAASARRTGGSHKPSSSGPAGRTPPPGQRVRGPARSYETPRGFSTNRPRRNRRTADPRPARRNSPGADDRAATSCWSRSAKAAWASSSWPSSSSRSAARWR